MNAPDARWGRLYVVATPLGNPEDITARAIRVLREADLIACEDTRRLSRLRGVHEIRTPAISYFEHNESRRVPELVARLLSGETIALISDAGTPAISDPGYGLVRAAIDAEIAVVPVPGPSAVVAALSAAGLPTDRFVFEGFLSSKAGERRRALELLRRESRTMVFYESARRLTELLTAMIQAMGPARQAVVMREMTKTYEEAVRGSLSEVLLHFRENPPLGEITIVLAGVNQMEGSASGPVMIDERAAMALLREAGLSLKDASAVVSKLSGVPRREVYQSSLDAAAAAQQQKSERDN